MIHNRPAFMALKRGWASPLPLWTFNLHRLITWLISYFFDKWVQPRIWLEHDSLSLQLACYFNFQPHVSFGLEPLIDFWYSYKTTYLSCLILVIFIKFLCLIQCIRRNWALRSFKLMINANVHPAQRDQYLDVTR